MSDSAYRAAQPPSKVLHIRNLPFETTEEEILELCGPFGKVAKTKLNVGANRNQAFAEFTDINNAISMITFYASSAEPAKIRGKTVYLQYSTRQEIVNASSAGETPSNVLLVTLENLSPNTVITIENLHLVFLAFGVVCKIATFEKSNGFQALVQYNDIATARYARDTLDGRSIPKKVLPEGSHPPTLRISFSAHTDLNVKFQSHRSRDFMNPYLPVAPSGTDSSLGIQAPLNNNPTDGNVLLCQVDNMAYPVTVEALHTVFSTYGFVQKIAIFEKNGQWQALVQYGDTASAGTAKQALEGHAIYDGGYNKLKITYSVHRDLNVKVNNERGWDYTVPEGHPPAAAQAAAAAHGGYGGGQMLQDDLMITAQEYEDAHSAVAKEAIAQLGMAPPHGGPPRGGMIHHPPPGMPMQGHMGPPGGGGPMPPYGGYMGGPPPHGGMHGGPVGPPPGGMSHYAGGPPHGMPMQGYPGPPHGGGPPGGMPPQGY